MLFQYAIKETRHDNF